MSINSHDSLSSPTKLAYNFLNKVKPIQESFRKTGSIRNWGDYKTNTNYQEFKEALDKAEVINNKDVKGISKSAQTHVNINHNYGINEQWNQVNNILEKAYGLGMVDDKGRLLHRYDSSI